MNRKFLCAQSLVPLALLGLLAGCAQEASEEEVSAEPTWAYEREFSGGPVTLILRLDKIECSLSDRVLLEQELRVDEGFEAEFPEFLAEDFEGFSVVTISAGKEPPAKSPQNPQEGAGTGPRERTKQMELEPDHSGDLAIAPLAVYFHRQGEGKETSFLTEEVQVTVAPIEDVEGLALRELRGIYDAPPAPVDAQGTSAWLWASLGALVLIGVVSWVLWRRPRKQPPPIPAHEIAYDALRRLVAMNLIEKGHIEQFFVLLSAILRQYIENRFHVHAPERTTEEFLQEAARNPALDAHRPRLSTFLSLCDQVKFAQYHPDEAAIQGAFDVTKQFLNETALGEESVAA